MIPWHCAVTSDQQVKLSLKSHPCRDLPPNFLIPHENSLANPWDREIIEISAEQNIGSLETNFLCLGSVRELNEAFVAQQTVAFLL